MFSWAQLAHNELNNSLETFYYFSCYQHYFRFFFFFSGLAKKETVLIPEVSALTHSVAAYN